MTIAPRLWIAPDERAARGALLGIVEADAQALRADPGRLARPLRVVVPGGVLREAVLDALVQPPSPARAGVVVQTLWSLAQEVLEASGRSLRGGELRFQLELRRAAAAEPVLARQLEGLEEGAGLCAAAVGDLSSAGLTDIEPRSIDAALAALSPGERERALALLRVARACEGSLSKAGLARHPDVYAAAARELERQPGLAPARELVVYGFAGATGRARALLTRLCAREGARWIAVQPGGARAALALAQRVLAESVAPRALAPSPAPQLAAFDAAGFDDEAREVARRVRALLDAGARPESIAVVARALEPRGAAVRRAFEDRGVPFAGASEPAGLAPGPRRMQAALELLREGPQARIERWFDALGRGAGPEREDLRCALAAAGVLRLEQLAHVDEADWVARHERVPLPQRGSFSGEGEEDGEGERRARRRTLSTAALRAAALQARGVLELLAHWPEGASGARQLEAWRAFCEGLGLARDASLAETLEALESAFDELERLHSGPSRAELGRWLASACEALPRPPLGGVGAGVRVLEAQSARGAAWEHLFVLGCERGVFPRTPRPEALLGPAAREALATLAPELSSVSVAEEDEQWLLAGLLGAAPRVVLSWRRADLEGREVAPAPTLAAVLAEAGVQVEHVERRRERAFALAPASARERAVAGALTCARDELPEFLEACFEEARTRYGDAFLPRGAGAAELARARATVVEALDPARAARADAALLDRLGPYLGLGGAGALPGADAPYVTGLERLALCPWQAFLQRSLGLEPPPDPLVDLPELDGLVLGNAVHAALSELLLSRGANEDALQAALGRAAHAALADTGVHLPGLAVVLARRARPFVERGLTLVAHLPAQRSVEVEGTSSAGLRFRADLCARDAQGAVLVDFKTGKPLSEAKGLDTRRAHLLRALSRGTHLQAAAYADSALARRGEYLYLREGLSEEIARVVVEPGGEFVERFRASTETLLRAWRSGAIAPQPEDQDGKPNPLCRSCEVRPACLRDDSGARARLREAARDARAGEVEPGLRGQAGLWALDAEVDA